MVKKILVLIFVAAILITGYISLRKLNYWERSVAIFKLDSPPQGFEARGGRGFGEEEGGRTSGTRPGFRDGGRPDRMNIPDSVRKRFQQNGQRNFGRESNRRDTVFMGRGDFNGRMRGPEGFEGRGDRRGGTINLTRVIYYLSVFALFAVIVVYIEKGYRLIFRKKNRFVENEDLII
jgi:hypothetical protein